VQSLFVRVQSAIVGVQSLFVRVQSAIVGVQSLFVRVQSAIAGCRQTVNGQRSTDDKRAVNKVIRFF
jgi:hypothetical protein